VAPGYPPAVTEQPQQAGQPYDPRERHPEEDPSTESRGDAERSDVLANDRDPGSEEEAGADYG
jgi:hypothetical protein